MTQKTKITREDILDLEAYGLVRKERRRAVTDLKRNRRVSIGPDATFYFESYETMFHQIHEMLWIEKGGEAQIEDELAAYNPLIPNGRELVATLMFEIEDEVRRARFLATLGGVEETVSIQIGADEVIKGQPEEDVDRTNAAGKASAIQFLHFAFSDAQVEKFKDPANQVTIGIAHPDYGHMAVLSDPVRQALASDFTD